MNEDEWSPTGFVARLKTRSQEQKEIIRDNAIVLWGANGEPLVDVYMDANGSIRDNGTLVDASTLSNFIGIDSSTFAGRPFAAPPGWSVEITHPSGNKEVRPVGAWIQMGGTSGEVAPMVPGTGEFEGDLVYIGQEYSQPSHKFEKRLIPPQSS